VSLPEGPVPDVQSLGAGVRASRVRQLLDHPDRLSVEYQPIVDIRGPEIWGYEVLARLPGADGPSSWFSGARAEGLGTRLELLVLARAVSKLPVVPGERVLCVNVSAETLLHPGLLEMLTAAGALADRLVFELTEHLDPAVLAVLVPVLDQVRATGARVAVGDAAGGYVGLSGVAALHPEVVKIDRSVVNGAAADDVRRTLAELVRSEAARHGATVVAVGVENGEDLRLLTESGVRYVQGFLVGRPAPVMTELSPDVVTLLAGLVTTAQVGSAGLVRQPDDVQLAADGADVAPAHLHAVPDAAPASEFLRVVVTPNGTPVALVTGASEDGVRPVRVSLRVGMPWALGDVARAAAAREHSLRYDPVVVVDDDGRLEGVFGIGELLTHLAHQLDG
jgi:EAL domain-containing protein (putative c-di-GMP-specific phosphodiesterase class I)